MKFRYGVHYRRDAVSRRTYHVVVTAASADEAREIAKQRDPEFLFTVKSPHRRKAVLATGDAK